MTEVGDGAHPTYAAVELPVHNQRGWSSRWPLENKEASAPPVHTAERERSSSKSQRMGQQQSYEFIDGYGWSKNISWKQIKNGKKDEQPGWVNIDTRGINRHMDMTGIAGNMGHAICTSKWKIEIKK